jgi:hypothetical protein
VAKARFDKEPAWISMLGDESSFAQHDWVTMQVLSYWKCFVNP